MGEFDWPKVGEFEVAIGGLAKVKDDSCAYERDDGDLSAIQLVELSKDAKSHMPKGAECGRESLFA